jgi:hypothetical protein
MKIIIKRNEHQPEVTIDLSTVHFPYAIRESLELALRLDGYSESTIKNTLSFSPEDVEIEAPTQEGGDK